jgi:hypothetical protein
VRERARERCVLPPFVTSHACVRAQAHWLLCRIERIRCLGGSAAAAPSFFLEHRRRGAATRLGPSVVLCRVAHPCPTSEFSFAAAVAAAAAVRRGSCRNTQPGQGEGSSWLGGRRRGTMAILRVVVKALNSATVQESSAGQYVPVCSKGRRTFTLSRTVLARGIAKSRPKVIRSDGHPLDRRRCRC